jgi:hypothetical protein
MATVSDPAEDEDSEIRAIDHEEGGYDLHQSEPVGTYSSGANQSSAKNPKHGSQERSSSTIACALAGGAALLGIAFSRSNKRERKIDDSECDSNAVALAKDRSDNAGQIRSGSYFVSIMNWAGEFASRF